MKAPKERKAEIEKRLSVVITEYAIFLHEDLCEGNGVATSEPDTFITSLMVAIRFCAGTVMTRFLLSYLPSMNGEIDLGYIETTFREMMDWATNDVCERFPEHIKMVKEVSKTAKKTGTSRSSE